MKKILLIDDDAQLREVFGMALNRAGYQVIEADSGATGLELARQHLPDLILSDIHMPDGDGPTLLRTLRKDPELSSKQFVLMTGRPDLVTPRNGMEDGADDFLVKPVGVKALLACVNARFSRASINWRVEDQMLAKLKASVPQQLPHEFFTPLAGIMGLMEYLRDAGPQMSAEEMSGIHDDVYNSALRLHRTLRNYLLILDIQNVPHENKSPAMLPADETTQAIQNGIEEAMRLNPRLGDINMNLAKIGLAIPAADLTHIVEEMVDNACKFSRQGTRVIVQLDEEMILSVTDEGRGMTPAEIEQIGAFQQFDRKKREQQGLGLGLVLVQKLASQCGARLSITSEPTRGTTVRLRFLKVE